MRVYLQIYPSQERNHLLPMYGVSLWWRGSVLGSNSERTFVGNREMTEKPAIESSGRNTMLTLLKSGSKHEFRDLFIVVCYLEDVIGCDISLLNSTSCMKKLEVVARAAFSCLQRYRASYESESGLSI